MTEPDELYTLRAQFWLGHYSMAMDEAKSIGRRPMSPDLKAEREEFMARCLIATGQYDKVNAMDTPGKSCKMTFRDAYETELVKHKERISFILLSTNT